MKSLAVSAVILTCAATVPAVAQDQPADAGRTMSQGQSQTQAMTADQFARTVATSDMFEIESSKLAEKKARDSGLKSLARQMVKDHTKTSSELKQTMKKAKMKVDLPKQLDDQHASMMKELQGASGEDFDRMYHQDQVQAHQTAVQLFESYAANGDNNDLKSFASKVLPDLRGHLTRFQQWRPAALTGQGSSERRR